MKRAVPLRNGRLLTDAGRQRAVALYSEGDTAAAVGRALGISGTTVLRLVRESTATEVRPRRAPAPRDFICKVCGATFRWKPHNTLFVRQTCSSSCARRLANEKTGDRSGTRNPNHRHGRRAGVREREGERRWYAALGDTPRCAACSGPGGQMGIVLHHVVYRQHVRRAGGDEWDPRNALPLCNSCHSLHHHRSRILPIALLPDAALAFAGDLLGDAAENYLARYYAVAAVDPRATRLVAVKYPGSGM
jgi:5-methylcytosine-specific restriction endonuclease McrA